MCLDTVWNLVKGRAESQGTKILCSSCVLRISHLTAEGSRMGQVWYVHGKIILPLPSCLVLHDILKGYWLYICFPGSRLGCLAYCLPVLCLSWASNLFRSDVKLLTVKAAVSSTHCVYFLSWETWSFVMVNWLFNIL